MEKKDVRYLKFPDYSCMWQKRLFMRGVPIEQTTCSGNWTSGCNRMKGHTGRHSRGTGTQILDAWA